MLKRTPSQALSLFAAASLSHVEGAAGALDQLRPPPPARTESAIPRHRPSRGNLVIIDSDFLRDCTLARDRSYLIDGEVHVRSGVTLTVEDGATILIRNGRRPRRTIDTSALIFDSGSALRAGTVTFCSARRVGCPSGTTRQWRGVLLWVSQVRHQGWSVFSPAVHQFVV